MKVRDVIQLIEEDSAIWLQLVVAIGNTNTQPNPDVSRLPDIPEMILLLEL